jgi:uncharacterized membrane protein
MDIALLSPQARLIVAALTAGLALITLLLRWGKRAPRLSVWTTLLLLAGLTTLAGEKVIALAVLAAAPKGVSFNEWRWVLSAPWGRAGMVVGIAVAAAAVLLSFRGTAREPKVWRRALLVALRAGACAAALVLFLEPALELRHVTREPNHVVVLVDDSRSMELGEQKGGPTRAQRAAAIIARSAPTFERWREDHRIDFYSFSDSTLPTSETQLRTPLPGRGDATLIREGLETVRGRYDSHDLAGIVVISDGAASGRFGEGVEDGASQDFLAGLGARVHTVWAGRPGMKDLAVARIAADEFAFVRTAVKVEALIRATGVPLRDVPVTLRRDGEVVKQVSVRVGGSVAEARATFELVPERIGKYVYRVEVPVLDDESVPWNNARAFVMRVIRDKIRVLQVAGRPSWDERAMRGFFKSDPNVDLISFFILRTPDDVQGVPSDEMSLIPFPTEELFEQELGSFDVIVLMNFEHSKYGIRPYLENIRAYVENGGGLAMVGGDLAFSSGGYYGTPVADALPVELMLDPGDPERLLSTEEFHPRLTDEGLIHPITQLRFERRDNEARWAALPALEGMNLVVGPRPDASVLLEHPFLKARNGKPMPVLATREYGKGRTMALLSDSDWRWGFLAAGREGDDGRAYQKFWENAIRWLIRDPDLEYLHVDSDQAEYGPTAAPRLHARLVDKDYRPARGAQVSLELQETGGGKVKSVLTRKLKTDDDGEAELELQALAPGSYRVLGKATLGDRPVVADDVFLVNPEREEYEHPAAREDVLRGISRATSGRYLGDAAAIDPDLPLAPPRVVRVDRKTDVELWSRPYLFLLAIGLLAAEWAVRRRRGFL